jgi:hypothetical protein
MSYSLLVIGIVYVKKKNKEQVIFCTCYWYSVRKEEKQRTGNILYLLLV